MAARQAARPRVRRKDVRARADNARRRLVQMTLWFPVAGTLVILANVFFSGRDDEPDFNPTTLLAAIVQMWGLYGPYLLAISAYLWAQTRVSTGAEKAPNGWQMAVLAHSFTQQVIILVYTVPLILYGAVSDLDAANKVMGVYQSAVHTLTAGAITYFFARPVKETDPVAPRTAGASPS
ncbi:MAG TPA: hypothetical protein VHG08_17805 [Longimicrobium sp.]|nr:hypothetical protein [Longimicrobium sp.]